MSNENKFQDDAWCPQQPQPPDNTVFIPKDTGQDVFPPCSALDHTKWTPQLITGFIRDILIQHYYNINDNIIDRQLIEALGPGWREAQTTGIVIESVWRWNAELIEKRPAIFIKRNAMQPVRTGLLGRIAITDRMDERFAVIWAGSHTIFCIGTTAAAAEILATETQRVLTQIEPAAIRNLHLLKWQIMEIGPVSELEEAAQNFVVPIAIGWAYEDAWTVTLDRALPFTGPIIEMK